MRSCCLCCRVLGGFLDGDLLYFLPRGGGGVGGPRDFRFGFGFEGLQISRWFKLRESKVK